MRILLVEDDPQISDNVSKLLTHAGYIVDNCQNGQQAIQLSTTKMSYDLIVLDWMLPDIEGPQVSLSIREKNVSTPIIMLTAKSQPEDIVNGLDSGVDDYLTKPFKIEELLARIRALIRRSEKNTLPPELIIGKLKIDTNTHSVYLDNKSINLSPKEYSLLEYLCLNQNRSLERLDILNNVWGESIDPLSNTVDVHIRYLRRKLNDQKNQLIKTIKGKGYMLCSN